MAGWLCYDPNEDEKCQTHVNGYYITILEENQNPRTTVRIENEERGLHNMSFILFQGFKFGI